MSKRKEEKADFVARCKKISDAIKSGAHEYDAICKHTGLTVRAAASTLRIMKNYKEVERDGDNFYLPNKSSNIAAPRRMVNYSPYIPQEFECAREGAMDYKQIPSLQSSKTNQISR